jgi:hypothetical protein
MAAIAPRFESQVARPLIVLVPLIKKDLDAARDASERAGMPYYQAAGEKMLEAKAQLKNGEFGPWLARNFKIGARQARLYMSLVTTLNMQNGAQAPKTLYEHRAVNLGHHQSGPPWREDVKESITRAKREAEHARAENLTRQQEHEADQKLALRLIEIGFKVLAKELHPDRGGSRDAMTRLNRVRDRLKQCV